MPKKPFSGRQKKQQLKDKRAKKRGENDDSDEPGAEGDDNTQMVVEGEAARQGESTNNNRGDNDDDNDDSNNNNNSNDDHDHDDDDDDNEATDAKNTTEDAPDDHHPPQWSQKSQKSHRLQKQPAGSSSHHHHRHRQGTHGDRHQSSGGRQNGKTPATARNRPAPTALGVEVKRINAQPTFKGKPTLRSSLYDPNRFNLHFEKDSKVDLEKRKALSREPLQPLPETALEVDLDSIHPPGKIIDIPKRPRWDYSLPTAELLHREETYFKSYLEGIYASYTVEQLSYFEHNLETWRQLWRVLEISDIVLLIADIRHPALHFPPALYNYVVHELKKHLVLVLNKIDLVSAVVTEAWIRYFREKFPELHVAAFSSYPEWGVSDIRDVFRKKRSRIGKRRMRAIGIEQVLSACAHLPVTKSHGVVDWSQQLKAAGVSASSATTAAAAHLNDRDGEDEGEGEGEDEDDQDEELLHDESGDDSDTEVDVLRTETVGDDERSVHQDFVTIGLVGHPNVGKSSLINALMGKKVVSASRTPGHTKHFQTIFLTPQVRLCDCPGLVFPSLVPKQVQILASMYPIAQVSEPYTVIKFLAERMDLIRLLDVKHPDEDKRAKPNPVWSAWDICEAWAEKRGYKTAKAARLDVYRAANSILRLAVDGRIVLSMKPPGFYEQHKDLLALEDRAVKPLKFSAHASLSHESKASRAAASSERDISDEEKDSDAESEEEEEEEDDDDDAEERNGESSDGRGGEEGARQESRSDADEHSSLGARQKPKKGAKAQTFNSFLLLGDDNE